MKFLKFNKEIVYLNYETKQFSQIPSKRYLLSFLKAVKRQKFEGLFT
jgi:hypothetical protein